jgi:hypothetical protein
MSPQTNFVSQSCRQQAYPPETNTVIAACVMFIAILIAWNLPVLREVIAAMKVNNGLPDSLNVADLNCSYSPLASTSCRIS